MSNFVQRTISSIVYAGSIVLLTIFSGGLYGKLIFSVVFCNLMMWAVWEYHTLVQSSQFNKIWSMAVAMLMYIVAALVSFQIGRPILSGILLSLAIGMVYVGLIIQLWLKREHPVAEWGNMLFSLLMVGLPFMLMLPILEESKWLLLSVFVIIWLNDGGAYCVGMLTSKLPKGNHKMFPRVSPAKSWEGLVGGIVCALLTGYVFSVFITDYKVWQWILFAAVIAVFGNLGDLMESLLKRSIGVKDSGKFLPGHGGVLDRFDSLLLAVPAAVFVCVFLL